MKSGILDFIFYYIDTKWIPIIREEKKYIKKSLVVYIV